MAIKFGAMIILLTCVEQKLVVYTGDMEIPAMMQSDEDMVQRTQTAKSYLQEVQAKLEQQGIQVSTTIMQGPPVEALLAVAAQENVDMIAIASHGRSGLGRVFYGSVAAGVCNGWIALSLLSASQRTEKKAGRFVGNPLFSLSVTAQFNPLAAVQVLNPLMEKE